MAFHHGASDSSGRSHACWCSHTSACASAMMSEPFRDGQFVRALGQQFFGQRTDFPASDTEPGELFGINRIELLLAQQRNVDGIYVRVEHGFGQARVRMGRGGVFGEFMHLHARAQGDQFRRRRGFFRRQEQIHFAHPRAQTAPAGEHAQRDGKQPFRRARA